MAKSCRNPDNFSGFLLVSAGEIQSGVSLAKVVRFYEAGKPEVLTLEDATVGDPGAGEVRVRHVAVGLNSGSASERYGG